MTLSQLMDCELQAERRSKINLELESDLSLKSLIEESLPEALTLLFAQLMLNCFFSVSICNFFFKKLLPFTFSFNSEPHILQLITSLLKWRKLLKCTMPLLINLKTKFTNHLNYLLPIGPKLERR